VHQNTRNTRVAYCQYACVFCAFFAYFGAYFGNMHRNLQEICTIRTLFARKNAQNSQKMHKKRNAYCNTQCVFCLNIANSCAYFQNTHWNLHEIDEIRTLFASKCAEKYAKYAYYALDVFHEYASRFSLLHLRKYTSFQGFFKATTTMRWGTRAPVPHPPQSQPFHPHISSLNHSWAASAAG
jgi:hypothetical protein